MTRPHVTPNQREVLYLTSDASGVAVAATYNTVAGGMDVNIVGGSASGTQYAELATTSPGTGTLALGRYKTAAPTLTDGQLYGLQLDASGNLKVTGSLSVGGTTDSAAWTVASSTFNPTGGVFNDSATALTSGQQGTQRFTANRAGHVNLRTAAGVEIGISSSPVRIDPTGTTTQPVSLATNTPTLQAGSTTTVTQATGTNLHIVVDSGAITASPAALPSTIINGQKAASTTAAALTSGALTQGVIIEALSTNTVSVFIGGTGVTATTGIELLPGGSTSVAVSNTNLIFIISASGTPAVSWIGS